MKGARLVREAIAQTAISNGVALRRLKRRLAAGPLTLAYHRIIDNVDPLADVSYPQMHVSPALFEKHLALLASLAPILSPDDIVEVDNYNQPLPGGFLITFDDGWRDNISNALPILRKAGAPAMIFISTGFVETGALCWTLRAWMLMREDPELLQGLEHKHLGLHTGTLSGESRLHRLFALSSAAAPGSRQGLIKEVTKVHRTVFGPDRADIALSWADVRSAEKSGIRIGGHTHNHEPLEILDSETCLEELLKCRDEIVCNSGIAVRSMSYPHSSCNPKVIAIAQDAGYAVSFGSTPVPLAPRGSRHRILPRLEIDTRTTTGAGGRFSRATMICRLAGLRLWQ